MYSQMHINLQSSTTCSLPIRIFWKRIHADYQDVRNCIVCTKCVLFLLHIRTDLTFRVKENTIPSPVHFHEVEIDILL